ncbi:FecCD family ABC transporter permease [Paenarthrobacter sp. NCHU4564]|uniref:FecCD family ABC transporter permease n=1 Tax=Paenarthrobacter sp. NCHU4564 TaxID=3451353 RepID=UPI003F9D8BAF
MLTAGVFLLVLLSSVMVGTLFIPPGQVLELLLHSGQGYAADVIWQLRLPRTLIGLAVGAALALAGSLIQAVTGNPLAEPGLLGVNSGAAVAVVVAIGVLHINAPVTYLWLALAGALVASIGVSILGGSRSRSANPARLLLAGAAVSAAMGAVVSAISLSDRATYEQFRYWVVGALGWPSLEVLGATGPILLLGMVVALLLARPLDTLALGEDISRGLGMRVGAVRAGVLVAVTLLCGAATATCGPVGFIGLATPHIARALLGPSYRRTIPFQLMLGPILLLGADVIGRVIAMPAEVETGIVTAFIGAPIFLFILARRKVVNL